MKNTKNYNLQKPDFNNVADIEVLNDNFDKIDNGIAPFYVATLNSTNIYEVATGLSITKLNDGFSVRIAIPSDSTGAVSIIIDGLTAVPVKKANGRAVSNLKANGVYTLTYYNTSFFLSSGGADESDSTTVGIDGSKVLAPETFIGSDGEIHTGTIPIQNSVNSNLNCGQSISLPAGYYGAESKITGNSLASQTPSNADASKIVSGYHAWINGQDVWGNATIQSLGGLEVKTGTIIINNTDLTSNTYSINLSQLNLPKTPKFVTCNWTLTHSHRYDGKKYEETVSSYTYFDWINGKCSYPTYTVWSHDQSGTDKIVDSIRDFTDKTTLYMHVQKNGRYLIPTSSGYTDFSRSEMTVNWTAIV